MTAPTTQNTTMARTMVVLELSPDPCPVEKSRLLDGIACRARSCDAVSSSSRAVPPLHVKSPRGRRRKEEKGMVRSGNRTGRGGAGFRHDKKKGTRRQSACVARSMAK
jgi:hypothetical protein